MAMSADIHGNFQRWLQRVAGDGGWRWPLCLGAGGVPRWWSWWRYWFQGSKVDSVHIGPNDRKCSGQRSGQEAGLRECEHQLSVGEVRHSKGSSCAHCELPSWPRSLCPLLLPQLAALVWWIWTMTSFPNCRVCKRWNNKDFRGRVQLPLQDSGHSSNLEDGETQVIWAGSRR